MTQQDIIKRDIKKLQQNKQFLAIMILLFVALLFWVTVSLISSQTTEKISPELQKLAKPLTPVIDTQVFERISAKRKYSDDELSGFTIFKVLVSKDGRTERVVPIDVSADDIEEENQQGQNSTRSLLQEETQETQTTTGPTTQQETEPTSQPTILPTADPTTPPATNGSNLGDQL